MVDFVLIGPVRRDPVLAVDRPRPPLRSKPMLRSAQTPRARSERRPASGDRTGRQKAWRPATALLRGSTGSCPRRSPRNHETKSAVLVLLTRAAMSEYGKSASVKAAPGSTCQAGGDPTWVRTVKLPERTVSRPGLARGSAGMFELSHSARPTCGPADQVEHRAKGGPKCRNGGNSSSCCSRAELRRRSPRHRRSAASCTRATPAGATGSRAQSPATVIPATRAVTTTAEASSTREPQRLRNGP